MPGLGSDANPAHYGDIELAELLESRWMDWFSSSIIRDIIPVGV